MRWIAAALCAYLARCFGRALRFLWDQRRSRSWPETTGLITDVGLLDEGTPGYHILYRYAYEAGGRRYIGQDTDNPDVPEPSAFVAESRARDLGAHPEIAVRYDPRTPEVSTTEPGFTGGAWLGVVRMGGLLAAALALFLWLWSR